jgi:hypothetical protein
MVGVTSAQLTNYLKAQEARAKKTRSRANAVPLDPNHAHDDDMDVDGDESQTPEDSPHGFVIQAMRLEAAQ